MRLGDRLPCQAHLLFGKMKYIECNNYHFFCIYLYGWIMDVCLCVYIKSPVWCNISISIWVFYQVYSENVCTEPKKLDKGWNTISYASSRNIKSCKLQTSYINWPTMFQISKFSSILITKRPIWLHSITN